jgi:phosphoribosylglycinamide formyltransferase-1
MNLIILLSGRGSNFAAICKTDLIANIACVISSKADANGLKIAEQHSIKSYTAIPENYSTRLDFETYLIKIINQYNNPLIVLAGFNRILTPYFIDQYAHKIINIHPSLLPAFIGKNAQQSTIDSRVKLSGVSIHYVTSQLDGGPIIAQGVVPVLLDDTSDTLGSRILKLEHVLYPFVIKKILTNQVKYGQNNYVIVNKQQTDKTLLAPYFEYIYY